MGVGLILINKITYAFYNKLAYYGYFKRYTGGSLGGGKREMQLLVEHNIYKIFKLRPISF